MHGKFLNHSESAVHISCDDETQSNEDAVILLVRHRHRFKLNHKVKKILNSSCKGRWKGNRIMVSVDTGEGISLHSILEMPS